MNNQISARRFQKRNRDKFIRINIIGLLCLIVGYFFGPMGIIFGAIFAFGLFLFSNEYLQKANVWRLGAEGEEKVANELSKLDESYRTFNDISLYNAFEIKSNIDHVVIGNNGIFAIETKNHNGIISCNGDEWAQDKVGSLGTPYKGQLKNPSRQAKRNAVLLKELIKNHEIFKKGIWELWVKPILVFTNEEAELNVSNPTVPVLRPEDLTGFIQNYKSGVSFTRDETESISQFLGSQGI